MSDIHFDTPTYSVPFALGFRALKSIPMKELHDLPVDYSRVRAVLELIIALANQFPDEPFTDMMTLKHQRIVRELYRDDPELTMVATVALELWTTKLEELNKEST